MKPRCPLCKQRLTSLEFAPFCSDRCKLCDLSKWFSGEYAVPAVELDGADFQDDEEAPDSEPLH